MSAEWPIAHLASTQQIWMIRAKTCASGRNSRVEAALGVDDRLEGLSRAFYGEVA